MDKQRGLYGKYRVERVDGSDAPGGKHHGCEYFVLDTAHDAFARAALSAYANACAAEYPMLAADLRSRYELTEAPAALDSAIAQLIDAHALLLPANPYCYFELAYTRQTEWMAWLCSKPAETDPSRKVLASGQGGTPEEACEQALRILAAQPSRAEVAHG